MGISLEDIKKLRDRTGAGMMDAKGALEEANGDFDKAMQVLRVKGQAKAAKKADRETKAGLIDAYLHQGRVGVVLEVNCETDFVARTDDFKNFVHELAMQIAATNPAYIKPEDVPKAELAKERKIYEAELKDQKKPAEVMDKIIEGKLQKYYAEVCLLNQPDIRDSERTVGDELNELIAKLGENIVITRFKRLELGVGDA